MASLLSGSRQQAPGLGTGHRGLCFRYWAVPNGTCETQNKVSPWRLGCRCFWLSAVWEGSRTELDDQLQRCWRSWENISASFFFGGTLGFLVLKMANKALAGRGSEVRQGAGRVTPGRGMWGQVGGRGALPWVSCRARCLIAVSPLRSLRGFRAPWWLHPHDQRFGFINA